MADIACVFHWSPETMSTMSLLELAEWRALAADRLTGADE